ncbi:hypothetical protein [Paenibacillus sp. y28]|uniref:hypothetical protein n=1 Tax=Paenibacillus sp. y28 TaxID=3129110 RepID=UPI003018FE05
MRTPISGICVGFRIIKGQGKDASDFAKMHILQVGTKDHDADLITVFIQNVDLIGDMLRAYSNGALRWIDTLCFTYKDGRENVWMLDKIFNLSNDVIEVEHGGGSI